MISRVFLCLAILFTIFVGATLFNRVKNLLPIYTSAIIRSDFKKILGLYRQDSGIGLSNFDFQKIACQKGRCDLFLVYRYRGRPPTIKTYSLIISWLINHSDEYVVN